MKAKNKPAEGVNSAEVLKKLLARIAKYRLLLVLSIILAAATVVLQLYVPILFGDAIDEIVAAHAVRFDAMWAYLRRILVFAAISGVTGWVMSLINNRMTYRVVQDIRAQSIRHIQRLLVLRIVGIHLHRRLKILPRLVQPPPPGADHALEEVPLRIVVGLGVQQFLRKVQISL